ncbi:hypothetical protein V2W30_22580 [Streptomyces sp. Q6]|uniref:Uncharacterized protein n=1 Tax=Streptomyces citrinus TaxID=3118173 RepID=A0ACD5AFL5_9ACTN
MSQDDDEPEEERETSRLAGGCVLAALGAGALAVVFAVSTEAGILAVWLAATAAVWWAARRRMSDSSSPPPPPPADDVYAAHSDEIARVQKGPGEGLLILYPKRDDMENDQ